MLRTRQCPLCANCCTPAKTGTTFSQDVVFAVASKPIAYPGFTFRTVVKGLEKTTSRPFHF